MTDEILPQAHIAQRVQRTAWCFTDFGAADQNGLNSIRADAIDIMYNPLHDGIKYIVWQLERCPDTNHLHIQGYVELQRSQDLNWVKRNISRTAHFEIRRGTSEEADAYCRKDDTRIDGPYSRGVRTVSQQGKRVDLVGFRDRIQDGATLRQLNAEHPVALMRYTSYAMKMKNLYRRSADTVNHMNRVQLLIGPPGCGKTRTVYRYWKDKDFYRVPLCSGTMWFDGYDGQQRVLIDDFAGRASKMGLTILLQLLDRYPIMLPVKGGFVWSNFRRIMITTNLHPREWYDWGQREVHYGALRRRFYSIAEWTDITGNPTRPDNEEFWNRYTYR